MTGRFWYDSFSRAPRVGFEDAAAAEPGCASLALVPRCRISEKSAASGPPVFPSL